MTSITSREACLESTRLGLQLYAQGQQHEALEAFDIALAQDDTICLTWVGKGKVLLELNRLPEAQAAFEHAMSVDPSNSDALHGKAQAHEALRREQMRQVAPGLDSALPLVIDGIGKGIQLIGHALAAHMRQC